MRLSDLDEVLAIESYSFPTPWKRSMYEHDLLRNPYARFFVALNEQDEVVGYIGGWFVYEECHIGTIAVRRDLRGRGIAKLLLRHVARQALREGLDYIILEVRVSNQPAINLYRKLGFRQVGLRKGYYTDTGEDAYLMMNDNLEELAAMEFEGVSTSGDGEEEGNNQRSGGQPASG